MTTLLDALADQYQLDENGERCGVSRQAVDEAITLIQSLQQRITALRGALAFFLTDERFVVTMGGNPIMIEAALLQARKALAGDA